MKKIRKLEKRFEKLPKTIQTLFFIYAVLTAIIFGVVFGVIVNGQNLKEMKNLQTEKIRLEQKSVRNILDKN